MTRSALLSLLLGAAVLLSGCAAPVREFGQDFGATAIAAITPGKTTRAELVQRLGKPARETAETFKKDSLGKDLSSPLVVYTGEYWFGSNDPTKPPAQYGIAARRHLRVFFVGDIVTGYRLNSSFSADSTNFDMGKVNSIKKDESTQEQVLAARGKPSGVAVYPLASEAGGMIYFYTDGHINYLTNKDEWKSTVIQFGADHRVNSVAATQEDKVRPPVYVPTPVYVPVYVPKRR